MSTDRQDLSPLIQKDAIAAFASANGMEIVRSYEDEGKSGVQLSNRRALRDLLRDVAEHPPFTEILVYDVSRWGRFQDSDAAAYYEYHCRLHGVEVTYIAETFANDRTPAGVLIKSMRRVMAAEYSRDIAQKSRKGQERVIAMGFQMGALPPLGYRRCSVSTDGASRVILKRGERKVALSDRVEWVLGPGAEVSLIQRICDAYVAGRSIEELAGLVRSEGWLTEKGRRVSTQCVKHLLRHEALIGNFVWGDKSKGGKILKCAPSRSVGTVPRIIDDVTWGAVQRRLESDSAHAQEVSRREKAPAGKPEHRTRQLALPFIEEGRPRPGEDGKLRKFRREFGAAQDLRNHTREFGRALCECLRTAGIPGSFDTRTNVLTFWSARVRIRLMWPCGPGVWQLETRRAAVHTGHILVARMDGLFRARDFFLFPHQIEQERFSGVIPTEVPRRLKHFLFASPETLMERLSEVCTGAVSSHPGASRPAKAPQRPATGKAAHL
jgi:DNA invertase Pin-like site-specific DNA recombinase